MELVGEPSLEALTLESRDFMLEGELKISCKWVLIKAAELLAVGASSKLQMDLKAASQISI